MPTTFTGCTPVEVASTIASPTLIGPFFAVPSSIEISLGAEGCRPATMVVGSNGGGVIELPSAGAPPLGLIGFGVPLAIAIGTAVAELTDPTACCTPSTACT